MLINPISNIPNQSFKTKILPSESLNKGFIMMDKNINSGTMKNMNYAKDFLDSLARISESNKNTEFKIDIDKKRQGYTYTKINGRRVFGGHNDYQPNLQDDYLIVEGVKKYASRLEEAPASMLDTLKAEIEEAENVLDSLKERYNLRLKAELEQARNMIFKSAE